MVAHQVLSDTVFSIMPVNPKKKLCPPHKVIMLGSSGVGKTTLVHRLASKHWPGNLTASASLMGDYLERMAVVENPQTEQQLLKVQLWDTAGQSKFGSAAALPKSYFRHARGAILVYDVTSHRSVEELLSTWVAQLEDLYNERTFSLTLVATNCDRDRERQVTTAQGEWLAKLLGADHIAECSMDDASAVEQCFSAVASGIASGSSWTISARAVEMALEQFRASSKPAAVPVSVSVSTSSSCAPTTQAMLTAASVAIVKASTTTTVPALTIVTTSETNVALAFPSHKLRSPSVHAANCDSLALSSSSLATTWSQLLQVDSTERKVLVGTTALLLAVPALLVLALLLLAPHESGSGIAGAVATAWLERLGAACSSLASSSDPV